jgi:hypothetical protein
MMIDEIVKRIMASLSKSGACFINYEGKNPWPDGYMVGMRDKEVMIPVSALKRDFIRETAYKIFKDTKFSGEWFLGIWVAVESYASGLPLSCRARPHVIVSDIMIAPCVRIPDFLSAMNYADREKQNYIYDLREKRGVSVLTRNAG